MADNRGGNAVIIHAPRALSSPGRIFYNSRVIKIVEVQATPNPDALKFIADARLVDRGAKSYEDAAAAQGHPLAEALFAAGPVASVFLLDRFVTVTKFPNGDWAALEPKIRAVLEAQAQPAAPAAAESAAGGEDILARINAVIDENVRPALAGDGGGLQVVDFSDNILSVHYQGACGGCPSAGAGTLFAIQNLLQRMVDPKIQVVSV